MKLRLSLNYLVSLIAVIFTLFSIMSNAAEELEKVSLQLDANYQFQFAGYIAAKEKGFYKDVGLDVELIEYQLGMNIFEDVLGSKAQYGVNKSSVYIKDSKIIPIRLLASYFQKSPHVLVTSKDIDSANDLVGKAIIISERNLRQSSLAQLFAHFYITSENTRFVSHGDSMQKFIGEKVNAVSVYSTNEPFELIQSGIEYNIIDPADYGYGSGGAGHLFSSHNEAITHPERTKNFIAASNKGWEYALAHQDELVSIIYDNYSKLKSIEALRFEAVETEKLMQSDTIAIGATNKDSQHKLVKQLKRSGLLDDAQELDAGHKIDLFTGNLQIFLDAKKEITMCVDPDWMPFEGIKNGNHIGITADIIAQFRKLLPIPISLIQTKDWSDSLAKAQNRECDILSLAIETPLRTKFLNFTSPIIKTPYVLTTKNDTLFMDNLAEVKDKKIGVVKGNAAAELLRLTYPDINIVDVSSVHDGLMRVESGELFGYVDNLIVIANFLQQEFMGILKVSSRLEKTFYAGIATRNDEPQLNEVFEVLVNSINDAELQAIYNKWVAVMPERLFDYSLFWKVLAAMLVASIGYFYYYLKLRKLNEQLLTLSVTDKLTGLYNRVKIDDALLHVKADFERYQTTASVIMLDIDLFKNVNDIYGHIVGDRVLVEFSNIIKKNIRITDYAGRWGGEEFLIICPNTSLVEAGELAEKLLCKLREYSFSTVGKLTASAGVNEFYANVATDKTILNVDAALYQSKSNGRDQVTIFNE